MTTIIGYALLGVVLGYLVIVHSYYRRQMHVCNVYPYYRLRDKVVWQMLQEPSKAPEKLRLYEVLNKVVHHTDTFGWKLLSEVVQDVTHAVLEHRQAPKAPQPLEVALVDLVIKSARANSLIVRLALTKAGRFVLLFPIARACYQHYRSRYPGREGAFTRRMETVRRVRRLRSWRDTAMAPVT